MDRIDCIHRIPRCYHWKGGYEERLPWCKVRRIWEPERECEGCESYEPINKERDGKED